MLTDGRRTADGRQMPTGAHCFKDRKIALSATCYLERVLVRMQLFPLDPLINFSFRLGMYIDVYIPGSVQVLKFLKLVLLSQFTIFNIFISTIKPRRSGRK